MTTAQDDQVPNPIQANPSTPPQSGVRSGNIVGTTVPTSTQTPVQAPVTTPVGGPKEAMAAPSPVSEWVSPSTPEVVLPQEVKDAGVEAHPVVETISADAQKSGVRMANSAMTVPTVQEETVNLESSSTMLHQLKSMHKKVSDSFSWLVRLIIKEQDKKAHSTDSGL